MCPALVRASRLAFGHLPKGAHVGILRLMMSDVWPEQIMPSFRHSVDTPCGQAHAPSNLLEQQMRMECFTLSFDLPAMWTLLKETFVGPESLRGARIMQSAVPHLVGR